MISTSDLWPPADIVLTAGDLTLNAVSDDDLPGLVELALSGIHAPGFMPFDQPWTEADPAVLPRQFAQYYWAGRASFSPNDLRVDFAVRRNGELVGTQGLSAEHYPVTRQAETGSWLALRFHGQGIGTRMRQMICAFLFDQLGADRIASGAFVDNPSSLAVSRKVGYRENGRQWKPRQGVAAEQTKLLLTADQFVRGEPVTVTGAEPLQRFLGLQ